MGINAIDFGPWEATGDGGWTQVTRVPIDARLHIPAESGRVVDGAGMRTGSAPWGGSLRVSCMAIELDGMALGVSLREPGKAFADVQVERGDTELLLRLDWREAFCEPRSRPVGPPQQVVQELGSVAEVWQDYRKWMGLTWPRKPAFSPDWVGEIPSAVYVEMWTGSGTVTHTFDDLVGLLTAMHEAGVPKNCLLYFWGFHAPFDTAYPNYWAADALGGEDGMTAVVDTAHRFGYRLMPHLNYWGCDGHLPVFENFRTEQVRDNNRTRLGWRVEGEPPIEYIRPDCGEWRRLMADVCHRFVGRFPVDALFLDQLGCFIDDHGCEFDSATQGYIDQIQEACPGVAFAGEIFQERCRSLPIWQVWGTPWCGLPVREDLEHATMWRELFSDEFTMIAHMGMPAAVPVRESWPGYYWYPDHHGMERAVRRANDWHRSIGAVPCVRVNYREFGLDELAVAILEGT